MDTKGSKKCTFNTIAGFHDSLFQGISKLDETKRDTVDFSLNFNRLSPKQMVSQEKDEDKTFTNTNTNVISSRKVKSKHSSVSGKSRVSAHSPPIATVDYGELGQIKSMDLLSGSAL